MQGFTHKIAMLAAAGVLAVGLAGCETGMEGGGMTGSDSASAAQAAERSARSAAAAQAAAEAAQAAAERTERMFQQHIQK